MGSGSEGYKGLKAGFESFLSSILLLLRDKLRSKDRLLGFDRFLDDEFVEVRALHSSITCLDLIIADSTSRELPRLASPGNLLLSSMN